MNRFNQVCDMMEATACTRLVIENDRPVTGYRRDGSTPLLTERFELLELSDLVAGVLPQGHRPAFEAGAPVRFAYHRGEIPFWVDVAKVNGDLRLTLESAMGTRPEREVPLATLQANPTFPRSVPFSLRWSESAMKGVAAAIGLLVGLGISVAVYFLSDKQSLLGRMFNLAEVQALVPIAITCMFIWGLALCLMRWIRLRRLEKTASPSLLPDIVRGLAPARLGELARLLESPACQASPLLRRIHTVVRQWTVRASLPEADLMLQQHVLADDDAARRGYSLIRTFVWALPVLGLIGTVVGISFAVGGFAHFLGGNVDDVAAVKKSLVGVTGGLSFAFLITLQGLLTSLVLMLMASALQTREEKLLSSVQRAVGDTFLPALQRACPESDVHAEGREQKFLRDSLQQIAERVMNEVAAIGGRLLSHVDQAQHRCQEQMEAWMQRLERELEQGASRLSEGVGRIGKDLETTSAEFLARLTLIRDSWDQHTQTLVQLVENQARANARIHDDLSHATAAQSANAQSICERVAGLSDVTRDTLQAQAALRTVLEKLTEVRLDQTVGTVTSSLAEVSRQTQKASEAVTGLTANTGQVLAAQETLQTAVRQLHDLGLPETLREFSGQLTSVAQVLSNFQEPIVFTPVSVKRVMATA